MQGISSPIEIASIATWTYNWPRFLGITADEDYGGLAMGYQAHCIVLEELSRASGIHPSIPLIFQSRVLTHMKNRQYRLIVRRTLTTLHQSTLTERNGGAKAKILAWFDIGR